jgi:hypothetical protein
MKKILIIVAITLFYCIQCNANDRISHIKDSLVSFLKNTEMLTESYKGEDLSDALICELRSNKRISEALTGIFWFTTLSSHSFTHVVIVRGNKFQILNMRDPLDKNILFLCKYLREDRGFTVKDILTYIEKIINIHRENMSIRSDVIVFPEQKSDK